jgi:hypothetical protein
MIYLARGNVRSGHSMDIDDSNHSNGLKRTESRAPMFVALAVAGFGVLAMLIVDHGPWNRPQLQTAEIANYKTTGEAARALGATVTPTAPKPKLEPAASGPKPVQPPNPATP